MKTYDFRNPASIVPDLLKVYDQLGNSKDDHWRNIKMQHLSELIVQCMGLHLEAATNDQQTTIGDSLEIAIEWTNRSKINTKANSVTINDELVPINKTLETLTTEKIYKPYYISESLGYSNPYWLNEKQNLGIYNVEDPKLRNLPESPALIKCKFDLDIMGRNVSISRDVKYKYVNPAEGEIREPLAIIPPATVSFEKDLYLFSSENNQRLLVKVRAGRDSLQGQLKMKTPEGWSIEPETVDIVIANKGFEQTVSFKLISPNVMSEGAVVATMLVDGNETSLSLTNIEYDHIPLQTILSPAETKAVKVPLNRGGTNIGYVMGAGDKVPENLKDVGYNVTELVPDELPNLNLQKYDAIVIGIRAYNAIESLKLYNQVLFTYAEEGGTLITQYNTSRRLNFDDLAPYPLKLSRKRVTDEFAEMRILKPNHPVMNTPNKITSEDFEGWVQERGLYFSQEWDDQYEAILSCNDEGEEPLDGSLLIAKHGKGYFVYTSLSWFRELPAGVPGAYRLFANLLALTSKKHDKP